MEWLGSAEIDAIDSCSPEGGFMGQLSSGHRTAIDLLVSVERRQPHRRPDRFSRITFHAFEAKIRPRPLTGFCRGEHHNA
jgi:hypothetical protein